MKQLIILLIIVWLLSGCAEDRTAPIHPDGWTDAVSENSHIAKIQVNGIENCRTCHGGADYDDYYGGSSGVSCYECREGGPSGHPNYDYWMRDTSSSQFHGTVAVQKGFSYCDDCHSIDASIGITGHTCTVCH